MIEIPLTQNQVALVDDDDYAIVSAHKWHANGRPGSYYAKSAFRNNDGIWTVVLMHRILMGLPDGVLVDHVNGNTLDNRRINLRPASLFQNQHNRGANTNNKSGFKGVYFDKGNGRWRAEIRAFNRKTHLGYFDSPHDGHLAYCRAAIELHKNYARFS